MITKLNAKCNQQINGTTAQTRCLPSAPAWHVISPGFACMFPSSFHSDQHTHTHTYLVNLSFSRAQWHNGQQLVTISTSPLRHLQPHPTSSQLFPGSAKRFCTTSSLGVLFFNSLLLRSMSLLPWLVSELVRLVHALPYGICAQLQCLLCKISSSVMYTQV